MPERLLPLPLLRKELEEIGQLGFCVAHVLRQLLVQAAVLLLRACRHRLSPFGRAVHSADGQWQILNSLGLQVIGSWRGAKIWPPEKGSWAPPMSKCTN